MYPLSTERYIPEAVTTAQCYEKSVQVPLSVRLPFSSCHVETLPLIVLQTAQVVLVLRSCLSCPYNVYSIYLKRVEAARGRGNKKIHKKHATINNYVLHYAMTLPVDHS